MLTYSRFCNKTFFHGYSVKDGLKKFEDDVLSGKIVEIGALVEGHGFIFSTVVNPGQDESIDQPSVHGIPASELLSGPSFYEAF